MNIYGRSEHYSSKHILPQQLAPPIPSIHGRPATLVQFPPIRRRLPPVFFLSPTYSSPLIHSYHYTRSSPHSPLSSFIQVIQSIYSACSTLKYIRIPLLPCTVSPCHPLPHSSKGESIEPSSCFSRLLTIFRMLQLLSILTQGTQTLSTSCIQHTTTFPKGMVEIKHKMKPTWVTSSHWSS